MLVIIRNSSPCRFALESINQLIYFKRRRDLNSRWWHMWIMHALSLPINQVNALKIKQTNIILPTSIKNPYYYDPCHLHHEINSPMSDVAWPLSSPTHKKERYSPVSDVIRPHQSTTDRSKM